MTTPLVHHWIRILVGLASGCNFSTLGTYRAILYFHRMVQKNVDATDSNLDVWIVPCLCAAAKVSVATSPCGLSSSSSSSNFPYSEILKTFCTLSNMKSQHQLPGAHTLEELQQRELRVFCEAVFPHPQQLRDLTDPYDEYVSLLKGAVPLATSIHVLWYWLRWPQVALGILPGALSRALHAHHITTSPTHDTPQPIPEGLETLHDIHSRTRTPPTLTEIQEVWNKTLKH
eukprot:PhF_6_TR11258/c0_g1_i2/m.18160